MLLAVRKQRLEAFERVRCIRNALISMQHTRVKRIIERFYLLLKHYEEMSKNGGGRSGVVKGQ